MRQYCILFILIGSMYSCVNSEEIKGVEVKGTVFDDNTGVPISNARVTILCWRKVREEETYDKVDTVTDNNGRFEVMFEEGFKIDVGSISPNYHPTVKEITDITKSINIDLKLSRNTATGTLKNLGQMTVFAREYNNINPPINKQYFGIDLLNGVISVR
ncbi:MAG: carboxypeptidase regulatory-like domain-containing protein [Chitinophagaceae bacterium]|nr:carboxypeptidase regulatory-like domain-containing protein [Chitinophagaceae bacterium]